MGFWLLNGLSGFLFKNWFEGVGLPCDKVLWPAWPGGRSWKWTSDIFCVTTAFQNISSVLFLHRFIANDCHNW